MKQKILQKQYHHLGYLNGLVAFFLCLSLILAPACFSVKKSLQTIPVTSRPAGALIHIDGQYAGITPVNLKLDRKINHVIRIELEGYKPVQIVLETKRVRSPDDKIAGAILLGPFLVLAGGFLGAWLGNTAFPDPNFSDHLNPCSTSVGALIGATPGFYFIFKNLSSSFKTALQPSSLYISLEKAESVDIKVKTIILKAEKAHNLRWIRVVRDETEPGAEPLIRIE